MFDTVSSSTPAGNRRRRPRRAPTGFVGVGQLAADAPISRTTIYAAIAAGQLPAHRFRGRYIIDEAVAKQWLAIDPLSADRGAPSNVGAIMNNVSPRIDLTFKHCDFERFGIHVGPSSFIAPVVENETIEGFLVIDGLADADLADLEIVLSTADTVVVTSDINDFVNAAAAVAAHGERIVLLQHDAAGPLPAAIVKSLIDRAKSK